MEKPIVFYRGTVGLIDYLDGQGALITGVINHPVLGNQDWVTTSKIIRQDPDGTVETRNTIYKPEGV